MNEALGFVVVECKHSLYMLVRMFIEVGRYICL